jgi:hypothetical protein
MFDFRRLAGVALILVSACAGSNAADKPDQPPATETGDSTQSTSPDDETTEPSTTDTAFASYSDLVERAIDVMFEQASRLGNPEDGGVDVVGVAGDLIMDIFADGSGRLTYTDVSAVFAAGGALPDLTVQGSADFSYSVSVSKMILSNTEFELSATSTLLRGEPLTLTQDDVGGGNDGTTSFIIRSTDPVLVLENPSGSKGPVYFPAVWFRQ